MIITPLSARKNIAAVLSAALLVSAPGPLAYQAAAQTMSLRSAAGLPAGIGAASVGSRATSGAALAPLSATTLSSLSAPSAFAAAPGLSPAAAAVPALAAPSASLPAAAAVPAAVPAFAPALAPAAPAAGAVPVSALASGRALGATLEAAQPSADGSDVRNALDSFYSGLAHAAPCIFANLAKKDSSHLAAPGDAPAGVPAGAPVPSAPASARFQVGPVHYAAMKVMAAIWSVWDRAIDSKWDKMPPLLGEIYLYFNEQSLRLHVWDANALPTTEKKTYGPATEQEKKARSADGSYFDDQKPEMAVAGSARWNQLNAPAGSPNPNFDKMEPNPMLVSQVLDKREVGADGRPVTKEAGILNDWSAAEIQAQVHDWGNHIRRPIGENPVRIKIPAGHPLGAATHETEMVLDRTEQDPTLPADYKGPAVHRNAETPGWDMSHIYGSSYARQMQVRSLHDGKLKIGGDGRLLEDPEKPGLPLTGFNDNITPLLTMYHTIWTLEHNSVADAVKSEHPDWNDQQIFDMARLRVTALNARIHTVEWTRALLPHPTLHSGMWADWYGFLGKPLKLWVMRFSDRNPRLGKILGKLLRYELIFGVPGTKTEHYGKNYGFVEEFFDVYRLHTMIRDWNRIQHLDSTGQESALSFVEDLYLKDALGYETIATLKRLSPEDLALSYGLESAGALTLNNAPDALRDLTTQDGRHIDLLSVDVIRTRERLAASRYNEFVRRLGERPPKTFLELTGGDAAMAAKLASVYKTVEDVDFQPGIRAERKPALFALGNRQFKPFVLSAPARLKNDRFLSEQYNSATYGASGMEYIEHTNFSNLIERHYPSLRPAVEGLDNSFRPWDQPGSLNDKLAANALASSEKAVSAAYVNYLFGSAIALGGIALGITSMASIGSLLLIPLAARLIATALLPSSAHAMGDLLSRAQEGEGTRLLAPLFAAEKKGRAAALASKIGAFAVLDVGGMIAYHLFAAHPVGAVVIGAAALYSGVKTLKAAKLAAADQMNLRVGLQSKLTEGLPHADPKSMAGDTAVDKHFWIMLNGNPGPVLKFGDTYATLRKSGSSAVEAFMTASMWHVIYARKTWNGVPAEQKARHNPGFLDINIAGLIALQDFSSNRIWADGTKPGVRRGDIDMDEFNRLFRDFGMHDYLTAYDLARIREANQYRDAQEGRGTWLKRLIGRYAGKRRAAQLLELFADRVVWEDGIDGKLVPAISRDQLLRFYQGGAHADLIRDRSTPR